MSHHNIWLYAGLALVGLILLHQVFQQPRRIVWKLVKSAVVGTLAIIVVDWIGHAYHFHLALNPATAMTTGILGIPGLAALITLHLWLFPA